MHLYSYENSKQRKAEKKSFGRSTGETQEKFHEVRAHVLFPMEWSYRILGPVWNG